MAQDSVLNSIIGGQNVVNRFNAIVVASVNSGIVWTRDNKPFGEMADTYFNTISPYPDYTTPFSGQINAQSIYDAALTVCRELSVVRKLRARLNVTQTGSSPWNKSTASANQTYNPPATGGVPGGIVYDQTEVANMSASYRQTISSIGRDDVISGEIITRAGIQGGGVPIYLPSPAAPQTQNPSGYVGQTLTGFFNACANTLSTLRNNTTTVTITVCHASCHSSCHGSRSRR